MGKKYSWNPDDYSYWETPEYRMYNPECPTCNNTLQFSQTTRMYYCKTCDCLWNEDAFDMTDPGDMPMGCVACGGPWPDCQTSCSMFDD